MISCEWMKVVYLFVRHVVIFVLMMGFPSTRDTYRCARSSDWGDQLPLIKEEEDDIQTETWTVIKKLLSDLFKTCFFSSKSQNTDLLKRLMLK